MADGGWIDSHQLRESTAAFLAFAKATYRALVKYEERISKPSSLRVLCRLDISVMKSQETGKYHWFVSEASTSHLCGMWFHSLTSSRARAFASTFGKALTRWALEARRNREEAQDVRMMLAANEDDDDEYINE